MEDKNVAKDEELAEGKSGCCFWIPCWPSIHKWELISAVENPKKDEEEEEATSGWMCKSVEPIKKVREWSELVAGPKWKTFIRRFNKTRSTSKTACRFHYDALSYALNFDDHNGDSEDSVAYPDFSSRYAWISYSTHSSSSNTTVA